MILNANAAKSPSSVDGIATSTSSSSISVPMIASASTGEGKYATTASSRV